MPSFDRVRKTSTSERFKPSLAAIKAGSRADMQNDVRTNNNAAAGDRLAVSAIRPSASFGSPKMLLNVRMGASASVSTIFEL